MKKNLMTVAVALILCLALATPPAFALKGWGKINKNWSYDGLSIRKTDMGCKITGKIVNKSREMKTGVYLTIYAWNNFKELLWSDIIVVRAVEAGGDYPFEELVLDCKEDNPYRISWKVQE